jgi:predicted dehydrogenase
MNQAWDLPTANTATRCSWLWICVSRGRRPLSATTFHAPFLKADQQRFKLSSILRSSSEAPVAGLERVQVRRSLPHSAVLPLKSLPSTACLSQVHTDLHAFLALPLDLVVITTPTHTHAAIVRAALEAGKHVVVEKPFTATAAEADALVQLASQHKRLLAVYHNRRWGLEGLEMINMSARTHARMRTHACRHC